MRNQVHQLRRAASGEPEIDQGIVHGHPVSFNPDINSFQIHAPGTTDGTNVLAQYRDWRNAVQFARRRTEGKLRKAD